MYHFEDHLKTKRLSGGWGFNSEENKSCDNFYELMINLKIFEY